ncbi:DddA-like double-stranded DNA deaminase toxin [Nocardia sp. NRRL S-836]|uniref:DddA-like double-stranded DNA deaminase toxin n=1 Tax=Nocardia sp. NRRL S-836 TaxID=1519492 RepID=UPI000B1A41A8|nr:DddA-like double-stranded DNA deaminase toxin [Nocardia sp. NRRL S-836]
MATFEEIAVGLQRVAGKAEEANAALTQAGQLASEAAALLTEVMQGSGSLEDEFNQAAQMWINVAKGTAELSEIVAAGCREVERYRRTLQSDVPTQPPSQANPSTPPPTPAPSTASPSASSEPTWADRQREQLPTYVTSGFYRDQEGNSDVVQSGQDVQDEHQKIAEHLRAEGFPPTGPGRVTTGEHVEGKVAWRLRNSGDTHVDLVINFPMCAGPYSCKNLVPFILKPGQSMTVHDPMKTRTFHGRSTR